MRRIRGVLALAATARRASPGQFVLAVVVTLVRSAAPAAFLWASGRLAASAQAAVVLGRDAPEAAGLVPHTLTVAGIFVVQQILAPISEAVERALSRRTDARIRHETMEAFGRTPGLAHLEDPALQDLALAAKGLSGSDMTPGLGVMGISVTLRRYLSVAGTFAVAVGYSWLIATTVLAVWLAIRFWFRRDLMKVADVFLGRSRDLRRSLYFRDVSLLPGVAKEVRVFGVSRWFVERFDAAWIRAMRAIWRERAKSTGPMVAGGLVVAAVYTLSIVLIARDVEAGVLGVQGVTVLAGALLELSMIANVDQHDMFLTNALPIVELLGKAQERIEEHPAVVLPGGGAVASDAPRLSLRFEDVTFSYPGNPLPVYEGLALDVPIGRSLAIVGPNGAGKTTLVKLLARLYDPTSGRIVVDGVDLRDLDAVAWQRRIGAIFQDFVQYPLTARENVALGAVGDTEVPEETVRRALALAGADGVVASLPKGLDTVLTRAFEEGIDPSGGQWQRLALARALVAVEMGAGVLVLDEPTANLDVRAEAQLFDRFIDLTRGLTTILISHRFSTVRRADLICVLEHGRITEQGTHEELVANGGTYARMFEHQAARFRDDGLEDLGDIEVVG